MYNDEIAFLNRKLFGRKIQWKAIPALSQIASTTLSKFDALEIVNKLQVQLETKCKKQQKLFSNMVWIFKDSIVLVNVPLLREVFGDEIDGFSGGGGRKMRVKTTPMKSRC